MVQTRPSVILSEFSKFINKDYPFDDDTFSNFNDIQEYWKFMTGATKELSFSESVEIPSEEIDIIIDESEEITIMNNSNEYEDFMAENTKTLAFESQTPDDLLMYHPADNPAEK
ncbi:6544_t:CDS:2 [Acaulospora morrowiae]|uniref:6544_t:CDS:1 n=1 Tax=Acaulospora morrowiae TaxID=94023 RepID=A0A9N9H4D0_9GLOM|nr:6544_t:CDS:2 [Acaulospora morrowiae]